jgi:mono/diheme cytochrome c family protein
MTRVGLFGVAALLATTSLVQAQTAVERGKYLVEGVLTCGNCHSPRAADGSIDTRRLYSGGPQTWDMPTFTAKGANITPDAATGIGNWSADDMKRAIRDGVRPSRDQLAPIMPYGFYKIFTPGDLDAVVAYLRTVPAVRNPVQPPVYKAALHVEIPPGAEAPMAEADLRDPLKHGFYQVTIAHCMECHTPRVDDRLDFASSLGRGGQTFRGPFGESVSRNITSHPEKGIGSWSDAEVKRAITQGTRKDGTKLKPPMGFAWYARMTDNDLNAVVAFIRTLPPKE